MEGRCSVYRERVIPASCYITHRFPLQNTPSTDIFFNNQYINTTKNKEEKGGGVLLGRRGEFCVINLLRWQFSLERSLGKKNCNARYFPPNLPPDKVQEEKENIPPSSNPPESIPFPEKIKKRELFLKLTTHPTP